MKQIFDVLVRNSKKIEISNFIIDSIQKGRNSTEYKTYQNGLKTLQMLNALKETKCLIRIKSNPKFNNEIDLIINEILESDISNAIVLSQESSYKILNTINMNNTNVTYLVFKMVTKKFKVLSLTLNGDDIEINEGIGYKICALPSEFELQNNKIREMSFVKIKVPTAKEWNSMIKRTGLDRAVALDKYENQLVELEGYFVRLGKDKEIGVDQVHALMKDIYFNDIDGDIVYEISHIWLNKAGIYFWNGFWYYNPVLFRLKENDYIQVRGIVQQYYDNKNKAFKNTLVNVTIISINGLRIVA